MIFLTQTRQLSGFAGLLMLPAALVAYLLLVTWLTLVHPDQMATDTICYVRNAVYIVEGRPLDSVNGFWSPLISWCLVPFVYCGVDGLHALRIVLGAWGGIHVVVCYLFMRSVAARSFWPALLVLAPITVNTARWAISFPTPDLLVSALLVAYCTPAVSPHLLRQKRTAAWCGVLGGLAYLAKAYAFPFFLAHFTATVVLRWALQRATVCRRKAVACWLVGLLAFLAIGGPWAMLLSWKLGSVTYSTAGRIAHTVIGPQDVARSPLRLGLHPAPPGRLFAREMPDSLHYNSWSPFDNWNYFKHQVKYSFHTAQHIMAVIRSFDAFGFTLVVLLLAPLIASRVTTDLFMPPWFLATVVTYCAGYALVFFEPRYIVPFLWPLMCIYCVITLPKMLTSAISPWQRMAVTTVVSISFLWTAVSSYADQLRTRPMQHRRVAAEMTAKGCRGTIAATQDFRVDALKIAYHMNQAFAGCPRQESVSAIERELKKYNVQIFLAHSGWSMAQSFGKETSWELRATIRLGEAEFYVFQPNRSPARPMLILCPSPAGRAHTCGSSRNSW